MITVIKADSLFDSVYGQFRRDPLITIEDERIVDVRLGYQEVPENARFVDLSGCTLLPGFIDAHDHLSLSPQLPNHPALMNDPDPVLLLRGIVNMKKDLLSGITTSRCLGDKNFIDLYLKQAVQDRIVEGPRIITCTRGIKTTHAHGSVGTIFNGVEEIRKAVRENIQRGADFVKIFVTDTIRKGEFMPYYMNAEEIRTAVQEAHHAGKKVAVHAIGGDGLTHCIEQGVDVIEHAYFASDEQIESLVKLNRWVVLTPSIFFNDNRWTTVPAAVADGFRRNQEEVYDRHQALVKAGVRYAIGTDATHGELISDVIFLVDDIGESLTRALQGITLQAARVSEIEELVGSITVGKKADLVAVRGDVEKNVHALNEIEWIMKDGDMKMDKGVPLI
jgi:imidazolonepropionase-like amidohydrolase